MAILNCHEINLMTADLGRHIANGYWFLNPTARNSVLSSSFYSFTQPTFPFINHHWGSGLIFYLVYLFSGWSGLSLFNLLLVGGALFILTRAQSVLASEPGNTALRQKDAMALLPAGLLAIPLLASRTEIRPESFSYLFCSIFYIILLHWKNKRITSGWLYLLPPLIALWINIHIYFVFGFLLLLAFMLEALLLKETQTLIKLLKLSGVCIATLVLGALFNPIGIKLLLAPFNIFTNYGYMIVENQSLLFLLKRGIQVPYIISFVVAAGILLAGGVRLFKHKYPGYRQFLHALLIVPILLIFATMGIRYIALFGFLTLPFLSMTISRAWKSQKNITTISFISISFFIFNIYPELSQTFGIGLRPGNLTSARFFKTNKVKGPLFNNYDIGSYLIYSLFPEEKVFVDNRPEAYSTEFLQNTYIKMQEDPAVWEKENQRFHFNAIFFNWRDQTPWAQTFLIQRIDDPMWAPVFVDDLALILLRRNEENQAIISRFEIPKTAFHTVKP